MSNITTLGNNIEVTPLLGETSNIGLLRVTINGLSLRSQDILDVQINYDELIKGRVSFIDTMNISEFAPLTYTIIEIYFEDRLKNKTKLNFIVMEAEILRIKDNSINVILKLEELTSNVLSITYLSRTFKDKTMMEIIKSMAQECGANLNYYDKGDAHIFDYFVTPANMSLLEFIQSQGKYSNLKLFSDRNGLTLIDIDSLDYSTIGATKEYDFTLNRREEFPYWNIMEYSGAVSRLKSTQRVVTSNLSNTTIMDLSYKPEVLTLEDSYKSQKMNGYMGLKNITLPDLVSNVGVKEISNIFHNETQGDDIDYRTILGAQQKIKIAVEGLSVIRVNSKIKLNLPRGVNVQVAKSDEVFSVDYIVTGVVDKIIGGKFSQFLNLQASDYGAGASETR